MINKKSIWFLTLFSLILVLSVYYITMPSELLLNTSGNQNNPVVETDDSTALVALRVQADEEMLKQLDELKLILTNEESSIDEKNEAFDKMKNINVKRGEEEKLEAKVLEEFKLKAFVKIDGDEIKVVIKSSEHNTELANNIMRSIQQNFESKKYISVKFTE